MSLGLSLFCPFLSLPLLLLLAAGPAPSCPFLIPAPQTMSSLPSASHASSLNLRTPLSPFLDLAGLSASKNTSVAYGALPVPAVDTSSPLTLQAAEETMSNIPDGERGRRWSLGLVLLPAVSIAVVLTPFSGVKLAASVPAYYLSLGFLLSGTSGL